MANELEVELEPAELQRQIDKSREALTQKIEQLEEKVTETVEMATASVAETTASVMETVQSATASVSETVDSVTTAVQGTMDTVRDSVNETVGSVKEAFNLSGQVQKHPWMMLAGAVAVGYIGGAFLSPSSRSSRSSFRSTPASNDNYNPASNGYSRFGDNSRSAPSVGQATIDQSLIGNRPIKSSSVAEAEEKSTANTASWLKSIGDALAPELNKLQGLAIGALVGSLKEIVVEAVPQQMQQPIADVMDGFTEKMGGKPLEGSLFGADSKPTPSHFNDRVSSKMS